MGTNLEDNNMSFHVQKWLDVSNGWLDISSRNRTKGGGVGVALECPKREHIGVWVYGPCRELGRHYNSPHNGSDKITMNFKILFEVARTYQLHRASLILALFRCTGCFASVYYISDSNFPHVVEHCSGIPGFLVTSTFLQKYTVSNWITMCPFS